MSEFSRKLQLAAQFNYPETICSDQVKLATVLDSIQYSLSGSFGVKPPVILMRAKLVVIANDVHWIHKPW